MKTSFELNWDNARAGMYGTFVKSSVAKARNW